MIGNLRFRSRQPGVKRYVVRRENVSGLRESVRMEWRSVLV